MASLITESDPRPRLPTVKYPKSVRVDPAPATVMAPMPPASTPTSIPCWLAPCVAGAVETPPALAMESVPVPSLPTYRKPASVSAEPLPLTLTVPVTPAVSAIETPSSESISERTPPAVSESFPAPARPTLTAPLAFNLEPVPAMLTEPVEPAWAPTRTDVVVSVPAELIETAPVELPFVPSSRPEVSVVTPAPFETTSEALPLLPIESRPASTHFDPVPETVNAPSEINESPVVVSCPTSVRLPEIVSELTFSEPVNVPVPLMDTASLAPGTTTSAGLSSLSQFLANARSPDPPLHSKTAMRQTP